MASLRNAVKRKEHKERAQPEFRKKVGLLEKKKDYKERSNDYHKKELTIQRLKNIAQEKNPDEFYFAMQSSQTVDGVHRGRSSQPNKYSQEELALMRTQDIGYLRTKAQADLKKVERLKSSLHFLGAAQASNHTIFVDDERQAAHLDLAEYFDTPAELLGRTFNRPRRAQLEQASFLPRGTDDARSAEKTSKRLHAAYSELAQRTLRHKKVCGLAATMEMKRAVAGKGRKRKLSQAETGTDTPVFKWRKERKR